MTFYKTKRIRKTGRKSCGGKIGKICLTLLWTALTLCSCMGAGLESDEGKDALLRLTFAQGGIRSRALSDGESTITDINVLVFNSAGSLTGSAYATFTGGNYTMDVNARTGEGCSIYAVANTGNAAYFKGVTTITDFKKKYVTLTSDPAELGNAAKTVMFGKKTGVKISAQTTITAADNFTLTRLCTKMSFTIKPAAGITVTGYQLCHVPMGSYITDETSTAYYNPPSAAFKDFTPVTVTTSAGTSVSGITYYIYENLAGKGTNTSTETRTAAYAPANATYLIVYAKKGLCWHSIYRIYLGGINSNDYTNYNLLRNYNYAYNIKIDGAKSSDARITYNSDAHIGDYLFSDGSWGPLSSKPTGSNIIGIIFQNIPNRICNTTIIAQDGKTECINGLALALTDANNSTGCKWGLTDNISDNGSLYYVNSTSECYNDIRGWNYCYGSIAKHCEDNNFPAFYYCNTYGNNIIAPITCSRWFLPSSGQWCDIYNNLGGASFSTSSNPYDTWLYNTTYVETINNKLSVTGVGGTPMASNWYWSSSETSENVARDMLNGTDVFFGVCQKNRSDNPCWVRAIIAF